MIPSVRFDGLEATALGLGLAAVGRPGYINLGRDADLGRVGELLRTARLVTVTGPGGVGKTRLALRLVEAAAVEFPDGVAFVSLALVSDPEFVSPAIAQALGLREIYVHYPSGMGESKLRFPAKMIGTARNMNTVAKLAQLAKEIE